MSVSWQIKREDDSVADFEDLFIRTATKRVANQSVGVVDVSFAYGTLAQSQPWDHGEEIRVLRDSAVWFRGRVNSFRPTATGRSRGFTVELVDPWWHLENLIYTQQISFVTDPAADPTPAGSTLTIDDFTTAVQTSSTVFLQEDSAGHKVDTAEMIEDVLTYAIGKGVPLQIGTIDDGIEVPLEELRAVTCAEAIRRCLRWTPGQTTRFDYTTAPATLHIRDRDNRSVQEFDLADEETEEIEITERQDLVRSGVRIEYLRTHEREDFQFRTLDADEAGPDPTGIGGLVVPIELFGSYLANGSVVAAEAVPSGLAQLIYDAWKDAPYEGRIRLAKQDVSNTNWLAFRARVQGGNPAWKTMSADIQSAVDDTATGRTEITLGPPQHLGPQDLVGLVRAGRTEPPTIVDVLNHDGGGSPAPPSVPTTSVDPRLVFGVVNQPDFILHRHSHWKDFGGAGVQFRKSWDRLEIYDNRDDTTPLVIQPSGVDPSNGSTTNPGYNLTIGYVYDATVGSSGSPLPNVPPADPYYTLIKYYVAEDETETYPNQ